MYWLIRRAWFPVVVALLRWGGGKIEWPGPLKVAGVIIAMVVIAATMQYLSYSTRNLGDGIRWVETTINAVGWILSLTVVVLLTVIEPLVGIVGGAFLIYALLDAFREQRDAVIRRLRFEDVALRRDDPNWRPAVSPPIWNRKKTTPEV